VDLGRDAQTEELCKEDRPQCGATRRHAKEVPYVQRSVDELEGDGDLFANLRGPNREICEATAERVGDSQQLSAPGPLCSIYGGIQSILLNGATRGLKIIQIRPLMTIVVLKLKPMVTWGSPI